MTVVKDPRRYFEAVETRATQATAPPVCLYLEVTNRCNLLCATCPRTFETLEPPADMSWELFTSIVDQVPDEAEPRDSAYEPEPHPGVLHPARRAALTVAWHDRGASARRSHRRAGCWEHAQHPTTSRATRACEG